MEQITITKYRSDDGNIYDKKSECAEHERNEQELMAYGKIERECMKVHRDFGIPFSNNIVHVVGYYINSKAKYDAILQFYLMQGDKLNEMYTGKYKNPGMYIFVLKKLDPYIKSRQINIFSQAEYNDLIAAFAQEQI